LFRRLGFAVEVDPPVTGGTPDFRMTRDSDSFLMEATTSFSGIVDNDRQPTRESAILAAVDQATNPNFTVRLEIEQVGPHQPKVRDITVPLEQWLSDLDPDDVLGRSIFDAPQKPLEVRGWKLLFTARDRARPARRSPGELCKTPTGRRARQPQTARLVPGRRELFADDRRSSSAGRPSRRWCASRGAAVARARSGR
jgi:hypothetical protein